MTDSIQRPPKTNKKNKDKKESSILPAFGQISKKKIYIAVAIIILTLIGLLTVVFLSRRSQDVRQQAYETVPSCDVFGTEAECTPVRGCSWVARLKPCSAISSKGGCESAGCTYVQKSCLDFSIDDCPSQCRIEWENEIPYCMGDSGRICIGGDSNIELEEGDCVGTPEGPIPTVQPTAGGAPPTGETPADDGIGTGTPGGPGNEPPKEVKTACGDTSFKIFRVEGEEQSYNVLAESSQGLSNVAIKLYGANGEAYTYTDPDQTRNGVNYVWTWHFRTWEDTGNGVHLIELPYTAIASAEFYINKSQPTETICGTYANDGAVADDGTKQKVGGTKEIGQTCERNNQCLEGLVCYTTEDAVGTTIDQLTKAYGFPGSECESVSSLAMYRFARPDLGSHEYTNSVTCNNGQIAYSRYLYEQANGHPTADGTNLNDEPMQTSAFGLGDDCKSVTAQTALQLANGTYLQSLWCSPDENSKNGTFGLTQTIPIGEKGFPDWDLASGWSRISINALPDACNSVTAQTTFLFQNQHGNNMYMDSIWCNGGTLAFTRYQPEGTDGMPDSSKASAWNWGDSEHANGWTIEEMKEIGNLPQVCKAIDAMETFKVGKDLYQSWIWCTADNNEYLEFRKYIPESDDGWLDYSNASEWNWWSATRECRDPNSIPVPTPTKVEPTEVEPTQVELSPTQTQPTITQAKEPTPTEAVAENTTRINILTKLAGVPEVENDANGNAVNIFHPVESGQTILIDLAIEDIQGNGVLVREDYPFEYFLAENGIDSYYRMVSPLDLENFPTGLYRVYLKGPMHRRQEFCSLNQADDDQCGITEFIAITTGSDRFYDFTAVTLDAGDVPLPIDGQDGVINVKDFAFVKGCLNVQAGDEQRKAVCRARADFNYSGEVTNKDMRLLKDSLSSVADDI